MGQPQVGRTIDLPDADQPIPFDPAKSAAELQGPLLPFPLWAAIRRRAAEKQLPHNLLIDLRTVGPSGGIGCSVPWSAHLLSKSHKPIEEQTGSKIYGPKNTPAVAQDVGILARAVHILQNGVHYCELICIGALRPTKCRLCSSHRLMS
jgi:hypothetical protein